MSRNNMEKALMDLKMALSEVKESESIYPLKLFNYRQVKTDMGIMVKNLEKYLYPRIRLKRDAVPIRLDGRYFAEALKNGHVVTAEPSDKGMTSVPVEDVPIPSDAVPPLTKGDLSALDKQAEKMKQMREASTRPKKKQASDKKTEAKPEPSTKPATKPKKAHKKVKVLDPTDVVYKWQRFYNQKDTDRIMKLYSKEFRKGAGHLEKRRKDFAREFTAYPDGKVKTYDLHVTRVKKNLGWKVRFSAEYSGQHWKEYSEGTFTLDREFMAAPCPSLSMGAAS